MDEDMNMMEEYWVWLSSVEGIGPKRFYELIALYEDARSVWDALEGVMTPPDMAFLGKKALAQLREARDKAYFQRLFEKLEKAGTRAITRLSEDYPPALAQIDDPPPTLYVRGSCPLDGERMIAIVGSRKCTRDGERAAREFGRGLGEKGVTVVSGLARGVDTAAHQGTLDAGGRTIAVLGCGADVVYPKENARLMEQIVGSGGATISEYKPGTPPHAGYFPARNRIISGLCAGTLLVEGEIRSGAMITVDLTLKQGRDLFAVPGSIYSPMSQGPNQMLRKGAAEMALSASDILERYGWADGSSAAAPKEKKDVELTADEAALVKPLLKETLTFDELSAITGFKAGKINSLLTMLELRGIIEQVPGGQYRAYL